MPTATYIALANITLTGTDNSVAFSSIPASFRDLVLVWNGDSTSVGVRLNSDSGSNYPQVFTQNASSYSSTDTSIALSNFGWSGNPHMFICNIMDYSATDKHKTVLSRASIETATTGRSVIMHAARWANTNAVNTVTVFNFSGNMSAGVTIALYGIVS
jgi:hypothetical protein